jgi:hypothetical protein
VSETRRDARSRSRQRQAPATLPWEKAGADPKGTFPLVSAEAVGFEPTRRRNRLPVFKPSAACPLPCGASPLRVAALAFRASPVLTGPAESQPVVERTLQPVASRRVPQTARSDPAPAGRAA